ncbi:hypothetical protein HMF8227_00107 [Saliniradius amylolyticus]|uniref:Lipid/polyisoprenoid-binding YceI-like domain-containing protein n=1 Tax=Saliniradius amylolyticus TaxID=2183582 RepID=A0A2S2DYY7_9ALTE|nr:YceI family protein [Saliniradius amylolyticus]AWL10615.1 hypothetical protein HMF8227_00107 [Saliniradius amylolyticus]
MKTLSLATALLFSASSMAAWTLDQQQSSLHFLSTKNNTITETHRFESLTGRLSDEGQLKVVIDLSSVNTNIDIRDRRMQEHLFKMFPNATFTAQVPDAALALEAGESLTTRINGKLSLNSQQGDLQVHVTVTRLADGSLQASTVSPIVVSAVNYSLTNGIKKLQEIAGLSSISPTVPTTFSVRFQPE